MLFTQSEHSLPYHFLRRGGVDFSTCSQRRYQTRRQMTHTHTHTCRHSKSKRPMNRSMSMWIVSCNTTSVAAELNSRAARSSLKATALIAVEHSLAREASLEPKLGVPLRQHVVMKSSTERPGSLGAKPGGGCPPPSVGARNMCKSDLGCVRAMPPPPPPCSSATAAVAPSALLASVPTS